MEVLAARGEVEQDAAAVVGVGAAVDQVVGDHAVDELGQAGRRHQGVVGDLGHRVPSAVPDERQDAPLLDRAVLLGQHRGQPPHDPPLGMAEEVGEVR